MMRLSFLLALFSAVSLAQYTLFESLHSIPDGWQQLPVPPSPAKSLTLHIHMTTAHEDLEQELLSISDPSHDRYGDHHSRQSLLALTKPADGAVDAVGKWLQATNHHAYTVSGDVVKVRMSVSEAERLLHTKYAVFRNEDSRTVVRTLEYSVPHHIRRHVAMIQPTTMFGLRNMRSGIHGPPILFEDASERINEAGSAPPCDNKTVTLECLGNLYGFRNYTSKGHLSLGISGFLEQYAQFSDLTEFMKRFRPAAATANFSVVSVNGGKNLQNVNGTSGISEANLDVQYAIGIAYPVKSTYYTTGGRPPFIPDLDVVENDSEPYLEFLEYLLKQEELPAVLSTSYGENEQTVPLTYRRTVCNLLGRLGARGVSVIFSSGDAGPGWSCLSNDGKNTTKFLPVFPAACPWVTAVGGTEHVGPEAAVNFSSGGFSETWPRPEYQRSAVTTYLRDHPDAWVPWKEYFNVSGRGFPDVATQGNNYQVILNGKVQLIGGTSASAPTFAGIVALLNDYRVSRGKKQLGFLNPLLYQNPGAFTDITHGSSIGCNGKRWGQPIAGNPGLVPGAGWNATAGWDPVTGLGTPNFDLLKDI